MTVLSLTWEFPYLGKNILILRRDLVSKHTSAEKRLRNIKILTRTSRSYFDIINMQAIYCVNHSSLLSVYIEMSISVQPLECLTAQQKYDNLMKQTQSARHVIGHYCDFKKNLSNSVAEIANMEHFQQPKIMWVLFVQTVCIGGLVQDCRNSSASALEFLQSCINSLALGDVTIILKLIIQNNSLETCC